METRKNSRGTTLLVILQAWILPCHGFAFTPYGLGCSSAAAAGAGSHLHAAGRQSSSFAAQPGSLKVKAASSRGTLPSLSMGEEGGFPFDPYGDEVRLRARELVRGAFLQ